MTGRIVAGTGTHRGHRFLDRRWHSAAALSETIARLKESARSFGAAIFVAIAAPGSLAFVCTTLRADKLGRVRTTEGWRFPNGNMLFSSNSVMGVRRQLKRRPSKDISAAPPPAKKRAKGGGR